MFIEPGLKSEFSKMACLSTQNEIKEDFGAKSELAGPRTFSGLGIDQEAGTFLEIFEKEG